MLTIMMTMMMMLMVLLLLLLLMMMMMMLTMLMMMMMLMVLFAGICFCHGGNFSIFPALTAALFGREHVGPNFGLVRRWLRWLSI
jgi:hypothetical protein